jgi:hypothetical protein
MLKLYIRAGSEVDSLISHLRKEKKHPLILANMHYSLKISGTWCRLVDEKIRSKTIYGVGVALGRSGHNKPVR